MWNARYREKFGFVFVTCASGRGTPEILGELKVRFVLYLFWMCFSACLDAIALETYPYFFIVLAVEKFASR